MRTTQEIVDSIDTRLRELRREIKTLDTARAALKAREAGSSRRAPLKARRKANRAGNAFAPDRLESLLSGNGNGGVTTSELAAQASADRDRVLGMLRELETAGRVRRSGQRRATRWHAITDEDRIRERAAELEATRRRRA
jgi:hypothetical protein